MDSYNYNTEYMECEKYVEKNALHLIYTWLAYILPCGKMWDFFLLYLKWCYILIKFDINTWYYLVV